jgi:hypothetical protein
MSVSTKVMETQSEDIRLRSAMESNPTEADTGSAKLQGLKGVSARNGKYSVNGILSEFRNIPSICCEPASCLRFIGKNSEY